MRRNLRIVLSGFFFYGYWDIRFLGLMIGTAMIDYYVSKGLEGRPLKREYAWKSMPTDCDGRGEWIYRRLYADSTPVDIAFLVSSHTIDRIEDTMIGRRLSVKGMPVNALNLGYCRFGRELLSVIARDLFSTKKPRIVVIEINERMSSNSHPVFPYYAETHDLVHPPSLLHESYPSNLYDGFLARLSQLRFDLFGGTYADTIPYFPYGFRGYDGLADSSLLRMPDPAAPAAPGIWRRVQTRYPSAWTEQLAALCRAHGARVFFLYIPSFHEQALPSEGMELYASLGQVLVPPAEMLHAKDCWRDPDHLNTKGAGILSEWVASQLSIAR
jgi:hypothetical protein